MDTKDLDWPGWPVEDNPAKGELGPDARRRMVEGSKALLPFLEKYRNGAGDRILEIGPFFHPLITQESFPDAKISYWENDVHALRYLKEKYGENIFFISRADNPLQFLSLCSKERNEDGLFDSVIISQVLNYMDYQPFLLELKAIIKAEGIIFINNVINYGLSRLMSGKRPKSIRETIETAEKTGYDVIEKDTFEPPKKNEDRRLILVLRNRHGSSGLRNSAGKDTIFWH